MAHGARANQVYARNPATLWLQLLFRTNKGILHNNHHHHRRRHRLSRHIILHNRCAVCAFAICDAIAVFNIYIKSLFAGGSTRIRCAWLLDTFSLYTI